MKNDFARLRLWLFQPFYSCLPTSRCKNRLINIRIFLFFSVYFTSLAAKIQVSRTKKKTSVWYDRGFSSSGYGQDRLGNIFSNCKRFHISSCNYFLTKSRKNQFIYVGYACSEAYCFCLCEPEGCPLFS